LSNYAVAAPASSGRNEGSRAAFREYAERQQADTKAVLQILVQPTPPDQALSTATNPVTATFSPFASTSDSQI